MVPAFDKVVFSCPVLEPTGPLHTQFGYHIIKVLYRNKAGGGYALPGLHRLLDFVGQVSASAPDKVYQPATAIRFISVI